MSLQPVSCSLFAHSNTSWGLKHSSYISRALFISVFAAVLYFRMGCKALPAWGSVVQDVIAQGQEHLVKDLRCNNAWVHLHPINSKVFDSQLQYVQENNNSKWTFVQTFEMYLSGSLGKSVGCCCGWSLENSKKWQLGFNPKMFFFRPILLRPVL